MATFAIVARYVITDETTKVTNSESLAHALETVKEVLDKREEFKGLGGEWLLTSIHEPINAKLRMASGNCDAVAPFHIRDMDDNIISDVRPTTMRSARLLAAFIANQIDADVQICNAFDNTIETTGDLR